MLILNRSKGMAMNILIPKEIQKNENRIAASEKSIKQLNKLGFDVFVESSAGINSNINDKALSDAGATIVPLNDCFNGINAVVKVNAPTLDELNNYPNGIYLICFIWPQQNHDILEKLAEKQISTIAIDQIPRLSRAQKMDVLSSMANIAGYRAVIEASHYFGRLFTGQITAAGKMPPAKVLVIGAGVAGLAAVGAAKSMGAIVRAFDTRPAVEEQVLSMGAEFLQVEIEEDGSGMGGYAKTMSQEFIDAEMALFREQMEDVDIVITTALIPGKPAPKLILEDMTEILKPGSVIVDLAAEQGGNCELTVPGEIVVRNDVTIIGLTNLPSRLPNQSSQLLAQNIVHLMTDLTPNKDGELFIDFDDEIQRTATVVLKDEITFPPPPLKTVQDASVKPTQKTDVSKNVDVKKSNSALPILAFWLVAGVLTYLLGSVADLEFVKHFTVFILSIFIGWQVIWNVSHALHTPLMAVTNAISGIVVLGTVSQLGAVDSGWFILVLALIGTLVATINIVGGFFVTYKMLKMFRKEG
jgi:H+-translocating NAD(P) transhydrogenase subunit alpha